MGKKKSPFIKRLRRSVSWPQIQEAIVREDGVHAVEHDGKERSEAMYPDVETMNTTLRKLGFKEFDDAH